ncbi:unnamed protein product [Sphenostylis stenocarpa]|uniref:Cupin type-1 domain-containing protein n=1 Tax=Sphenostylis stenocarpa TaxID=92480 RepID=A0AA86VXA4_9FABA|nr:unnamed protein product [Sphenostylis stenocarpa]
MVLRNTREEVVLKLKKGDVIPVPIGSVSWWFNNGDSDLIIIFLGETSKALIPAEISYFFLTGVQGVIGGFSTELTSKIYGLDKDGVEKLDLGLSVIKVKLEPGAIKAPSYQINHSVQLIYIAKGSGKIEFVDFSGKSVLDTQVEAGHLLVVPQFLLTAAIAGEEGLESVSIVTAEALFDELGGRASIWIILSPSVQQASFKVDSEFQSLFISKIKETTNLIPPTT